MTYYKDTDVVLEREKKNPEKKEKKKKKKKSKSKKKKYDTYKGGLTFSW